MLYIGYMQNIMSIREYREALELNHLAYESTMEVLEELGEETMQAFIWQLGTHGIEFAPESFNLNHFATKLHELLGDGSESLLEEIYQNILCRIELIRESGLVASNNGPEGAIDGGQRLSALQKIQDFFGEWKNNAD